MQPFCVSAAAEAVKSHYCLRYILLCGWDARNRPRILSRTEDETKHIPATESAVEPANALARFRCGRGLQAECNDDCGTDGLRFGLDPLP